MKDSSTAGNAVAIIAIVIVIALLGGFIYWYQSQQATPDTLPTPVPVQAPAPVQPAPTPEPVIEPEPIIETPEPEPVDPVTPEPVPEPEIAEPEIELPPLNESDAFVSEQIAPESSDELTALIVPDEVVRKTVRAAISIANNRLVNQYRPVLSPLPTLGVTQISGGPDAEYELTEANYRRYDKHIALMESIEPAALARIFTTLEPMFDEAYAEQGLEGKFRPVLLNAIDNMLATPEVTKTLTLKRPAVMYKYTDPELEALSDPQKLMLRIGPENRAKVKAYLEKFETELTAP
ncbi:DUF3014 domain-containing protein [Gilvimarinus sp. SDUM040013]|uniref:DUF3014 domain-containing protein n=1 Tax=Gilvimarinus gilvus TaxID=3058038 RepID=A0ABU4RT63_9GAMM|nr:DUF3014 domain-containing protein [Gilvimarinus sp. SDUM040013]MDO3387024.1 DUF3014 domain-containing protein [Gilvimarinus sp. SDUM040013]MDX6848082.1 DUF3014 domain-containing protein [Gilvimarinus sp. SDUM040013]